MRQRVFKFQKDDVVYTMGNRHTGVIVRKFHKCPMDGEWINAQRIPVDPADLNKPWYRIHTDRGGSVVCAESDIVFEF